MKRLNFGCGNDIKEGYDNFDKKDFDFNIIPYPINDNTYKEIYCRHVLEHLHDPEIVMGELWRICEKGAIIHIEVPHYRNKGAYTDIGHVHFFADDTFEYLISRDLEIHNIVRFKLIHKHIKYTWIGNLIPNLIANKLSIFIGGIIAEVWVDLEVVK